MKRVTTALVLAPLVLLLVFLGPRWMIDLAVCAVALMAGWEFLGLAERCGARPPRIAVMAAIGLLFIGNFERPDQMMVIIGMLSLGLLVYCTFRPPVDRVLVEAASSIFTLYYVGVTLVTLPSLRDLSNGPSLVVFLLCVVWSGDIAAMYVGRMWGKRKLAPALSPNKTWEGTLGSVGGSLLTALLLMGLGALMSHWSAAPRLSYADGTWWYWLLLAVVLNAAAQVGDLAESALKRSAGVKDSGTILPGHGGMLDRIDALMLAAPVLWYAQMIQRM